MVKGHATPDGTARYRFRFQSTSAADHFREARGLWLSSIGLGTYLGEPTEAEGRARPGERGAVHSPVFSH